MINRSRRKCRSNLALRRFPLLLLAIAALAGGVVLAVHDRGETEIRALVREHEDGTLELALRQTTDDGSWSDLILPERRFLGPERDQGRWYTSSVAAIEDTGRGNTYCVVTHSREGDFFWRQVEFLADAWAEHRGEQVRYFAEPEIDGQAARIVQCADDGVDAIATTLPDPDKLEPAIAQAIAAGVVVTSFNSGAQDSARVGSFAHASVNELQVGRDAAREFEAAGAQGPILCVIHEEGNIGLVERCDGLEEAYGGGPVERFQVVGVGDLAGTGRAIAGKLSAGDYAGVFTLNQQVAIAAMRASPEGVLVATVDWDRVVAEAVADGDLQFAISTLSGFQIQGTLDTAAMLLSSFANTRGRVSVAEFRTMVSHTRVEVGTFIITQDNTDLVLRIYRRIAAGR